MSLSAIGTAQNAMKNKNSGNFLDSLTNKYILKPKDAKGIGGFVFDYEGDTSLEIHADITDHYTENNTAINDHIAMKPVRITLKGYIGELVQIAPTGLNGLLDAVNNKLGIVDAYLGKYTPGMVQKLRKATGQAQNFVNKINSTVARVKNVVGFFSKSSAAPTKQELAYQMLSNMFTEKLAFSVVTPFKFFDNMVIESLTFRQDENTKYEAEITVVVKQIRYASLEYVAFNPSKFAGRAMSQAQGVVDKGIQTAKKATAPLESIAHQGFNKLIDYFKPAQ